MGRFYNNAYLDDGIMGLLVPISQRSWSCSPASLAADNFQINKCIPKWRQVTTYTETVSDSDDASEQDKLFTKPNEQKSHNVSIDMS